MTRQWLWRNFVGYRVLKMLPFVTILIREGYSNAIEEDSTTQWPLPPPIRLLLATGSEYFLGCDAQMLICIRVTWRLSIQIP